MATAEVVFSLWQGGTGVIKTGNGELVASTTKQVKGGTSELRAEGDKLCYISATATSQAARR